MENQESKILDKEEMREKDAEFAQAVALKLNELLDEGVLTSEALKRASPEIIDEFICRFQHRLVCDDKEIELGKDKFEPEEKDKITTLFGVHGVSVCGEGRNGKDEPMEEKIKEKMRGFIGVLDDQRDKDEPTVTGALLFGSRMDQRKTSGRESDLDVVFYIDLPPEKTIKRTYCDAIENAYREKIGHDPVVGDLEHVFVERPADLLSILTHKGYPSSMFNTFAPWTLDAAYFVGELPGYSEKEINDLIHNYCFSKDIKERKRAVVESVRKQLYH